MKKTLKRITGALVIVLAVGSLCRLFSIIPARSTMRTIERAFRGADRITIIQGPMCHTPKRIGSVLADVTDADDISDFFSALQIQPSLVQLFFMQCACGGDIKVVVSRGDAEPFEFTIHHGQSIRLPHSFVGDAQLTAGSAFNLALWLTKHGVYKDTEDVHRDRVPPCGGNPP